MKFTSGLEMILNNKGIIIAKCFKCEYQASGRIGDVVIEAIKDHMETHKDG